MPVDVRGMVGGLVPESAFGILVAHFFIIGIRTLDVLLGPVRLECPSIEKKSSSGPGTGGAAGARAKRRSSAFNAPCARPAASSARARTRAASETQGSRGRNDGWSGGTAAVALAADATAVPDGILGAAFGGTGAGTLAVAVAPVPAETSRTGLAATVTPTSSSQEMPLKKTASESEEYNRPT